ncbi:MAG: erythromycin esterase family protein [Bacteroidia bacterium]
MTSLPKLFLLLFLLISGFLFPQTGPTKAEFLNQNAIPVSLDSVNLFSPNTEKAVLALFENKSVVGLGEATHGTLEFTVFKSALIKLLIQKLNYRTIAMECSPLSAVHLNKIIDPAETCDAEKELVKVEYWIWKTPEFLDLLKWLKTYNKTNISSSITITGIDVSIGTVIKDLNQHDSLMAVNVREALSKTQGNKIILLAHNGHISRSEYFKTNLCMGSFLNSMIGNKYYALGLLSDSLNFTANRWPNYERQDWSVNDCPPNSLTNILYHLPQSTYFVDFSSNANALGEIGEAIEKCYNIGSNYDPERNAMACHIPLHITQCFDGIVSFRKTHASLNIVRPGYYYARLSAPFSLSNRKQVIIKYEVEARVRHTGGEGSLFIRRDNGQRIVGNKMSGTNAIRSEEYKMYTLVDTLNLKKEKTELGIQHSGSEALLIRKVAVFIWSDNDWVAVPDYSFSFNDGSIAAFLKQFQETPGLFKTTCVQDQGITVMSIQKTGEQ